MQKKPAVIPLIDQINQIKRLGIMAIYSDDYLMDRLVLKGGNAIDLIYRITTRGSRDLDFSMEKDFLPEDLPRIEAVIESNLKLTFAREKLEIFDVRFTKKPEKVDLSRDIFWGGYRVEFKVIEADKAKDLESKRRQSVVLNESQSRIFNIDISKFEFCTGKVKRELEGLTIYVYTPEMIVFEKIRAICQQMPEYASKKPETATARARDFFDIYTVVDRFGIDPSSEENRALLRNIFDAKQVPLSLIAKIPRYREFHQGDFAAVEDTVREKEKIKTFDFYFDYVAAFCEKLKSLGDV
ncbi:MAG: hypothetical protein A2902_05490 [Elusimicrobia bacterium RIFCSPLOWO2_01_FULL_64_13]|nr:MAG: hypothetical protein A2902_05490 [Elusimicrobia bacterium RIFCSPLOWO2_01_FULL_64_13]